MSNEIINKVAQSGLITLNLEEYYPAGERTSFDLAPLLQEGFLLKEKELRAFVDSHEWKQYQDHYVALYCSTEAIIPVWAYMLISSALAPYAKRTVMGRLRDLESTLFEELIQEMDLSAFQDERVILKGCSSKPIPESAYTALTQRLQPIAKSIMYGEACSTVPIYKKK